MNRYTKIFSRLLPAIMLVMTACNDDIDIPATVDGPEGEDTTISLTIQAPEMSHLESRANMTTSEANSVRSLWVGIYSYATSRSTLSDGNNSGLLLQNGQHGFTSGNKSHTRYTLTGINTKSGRSYIVAVANPDLNYGYTMDANGKLGAKSKLSDLLAQADTWDKFQSIVIEREPFQNAAVLGVPNNSPLPMSGIYVDNENLTHPDDWTKVEPYQIPLSKNGLNLKGSIHLRRPFTQVKFNVSVSKDIVSFDVESYRVYNVPTYGWLYERSQSDDLTNRIDYANAGDAMQPIVDDNTNYKPSLVYPSTNITENNGVYSFDFWMMENKRTGRADFCTDYQKREREYKNADGTNSGVYESLCPTAEPTLNNLATYVEIRGTLTYKNGNNVENPSQIPEGEGAGTLPGNVASRTVEATYKVHLGYAVGNNEGEKARDFNNYRNSIYNYNVTVRSANSIIVEAFRIGDNPELQPGAEGVVTDVTDNLFECDAHPEVFNIYLTTEEIANFSFTMRSYYNNQEIVIYQQKKDENGVQKNNIPERGDDNFKFYNWIELVPTGLTAQTEANKNRIKEFPNLARNPNWKTQTAAQRGFYYPGELAGSGLTGQYFTVYVNEHAYVPRYGDANWGYEVGNNWHAYVNTTRPRQAWFNVSQETSKDGQNVYYRSKYALSQRSIQTYYNMGNNTVATALGLEHVNESFGMNIRWTKDIIANLDPDNGRYNVWLGVNGTDGGSEADNWSSVVKLNTSQIVNEITNSKTNGQMQYAQDYFNTAEKTWNVPMQNTIAGNSLSGTAGMYDGKANQYDPQVNGNNIQYIEALQACMNRNRDENGNGVIDAAELKWYLPASGKYARIILGRRTLSNPLMNYQQSILRYACTNGGNTIYHFIASDNVIVWADEGMSSSSFYGANPEYAQYYYAPWQIRCIRNLGTNLTSVSRGEKVTPAYDDKTKNTTTGSGVVKVNAYYGAALRDPVTTYLPMHKSNSPYNALGRYGFEIAEVDNGNTNNPNPSTNEASATAYRTSYDTYNDAVIKATPCSKLNQGTKKGWRIPNQAEAVIMRRMGILRNNGNTTSQFMTCTQEYYSNATPAVGSDTPGSAYRILTVRTALATAQVIGSINVVRCVRDLTAEEAAGL
ncbi:hypothetical protein [uncultured Muribaculum sp.]|uniref:hypothetical protein n=1 Tax=uncultured Muribaculum sp. TaxID=1918613 RepID=UPI0025B0566A|nr:hypothetical protein [uncultured Muribaculum sp.]